MTTAKEGHNRHGAKKGCISYNTQAKFVHGRRLGGIPLKRAFGAVRVRSGAEEVVVHKSVVVEVVAHGDGSRSRVVEELGGSEGSGRRGTCRVPDVWSFTSLRRW